MNIYSEISVLVIAYRRKSNIEKILKICEQNKIAKIYIALDGPKLNSVSGLKDHLEIRNIINNFQQKYYGKIIFWCRDNNLGCAVSVLSACDWAFRSEENLIILEDDCIPTNDFFKFAISSIDVMKNNPHIWIACGMQFAPKELSISPWVLSRYALIWGWSTNRNNWQEISSNIKKNLKLYSNRTYSIRFWEAIYWNEGSRRAHQGWTDVWDTILVKQMLVNKKLAILPNTPLVMNTGDDVFATNTFGNSNWLNLETGFFTDRPGQLDVSAIHDEWLRKFFYKISIRHSLTTKITRLRDTINRLRVSPAPLISRWEQANSIHNSRE